MPDLVPYKPADYRWKAPVSEATPQLVAKPAIRWDFRIMVIALACFVVALMAPGNALAADSTCVWAPVGTGIYADGTEANPSYGTLPRPERMTVEGTDGGRLRVGRRGIDNPAYPMYVDPASVSVVACIGGQDTGQSGETLLETLLRKPDPVQEYINAHMPPSLVPALTWINGVANEFNSYFSVPLFAFGGVAYAIVLAVLLIIRRSDCRKYDVPRIMIPITLGALFSTNLLPFLFHTLFAITYLLVGTMMMSGVYFPRGLKEHEWRRGPTGSWHAVVPRVKGIPYMTTTGLHARAGAFKVLLDRRRAFRNFLRGSAWWAMSNIIATYELPLAQQISPTILRAMPGTGDGQGSPLAIGLMAILLAGTFFCGVVWICAIFTEYLGWMFILPDIFFNGRYLAAEIAFRKTWAKVDDIAPMPYTWETNTTSQQTQGSGQRRKGRIGG